MTGRVVNLRTRRKQKARDAKRAAKGAAPGVTRAERARTEAENRLLRERLEGHRRDTPEGDAADDG